MTPKKIFFSLIIFCIVPIIFFILLKNVGSPQSTTIVSEADEALLPVMETDETKYLMFQIFTSSPDPRMAWDPRDKPIAQPPSKAAIAKVVDDIIQKIGSTGTEKRKLGFIIGPFSFDHSDAQIQQMISDATDIAIERNIAVGFHIDDSLMWAKRTDLMAPDTIEWTSWDGTRSTGMLLDWGSERKIPPRMCLNAPKIQQAVTHQAKSVIGSAIKEATDKLAGAGKSDLFAGVIVGWETHLGQDYETKEHVGYCAFTNRGYSEANPPSNMARESASVVKEFIDLWAKGITDAGVNPDRIYSHVAFVSEKTFMNLQQQFPKQLKNVSYEFLLNFGPSTADPEVAKGPYHRPGFSTYPSPGTFDQISAVTNGTPWASAEGTNILPGDTKEGSPITTETYLARMYNHGATLVTLFGWGIGDSSNPFRKTAEAPDSIKAYQKFLNGAE